MAIVPMYIIQSWIDELTPFDTWHDDFLQSEIIASRNWKEPKVFKTIKLYPVSSNELFQQMRDANIKWSNNVPSFPAFQISSYEREIDLVEVTIADLGFRKSAPLSEVYSRADRFGLGLCPQDVGPQLALQYPELAVGKKLCIGMKPIIIEPFCNLTLFNIEHRKDGLFLNAPEYGLNYYFDPNTPIVFVSFRK